MKKDIAVRLKNIAKVYKLYDTPIDRLKESTHPFKKKYHKEFHALRNINLEINKGEVLGIVGVNGAGKSTLLKIISGVMTPTAGRVQINGRVNAILELGSGLKPEMTGRENIKLNLQINEITQHIEKITEEIIEFADIGDYIEQPVKTYSSGMKARLGFGIATSTDPDILIVDEVLAVGDIVFQRKCYNKIDKLFSSGKTVIFVSHSVQSVVQFCSRAVLLYDREIILDEKPKKVTDFYQKLIFSNNRQKVLDEIRGKVRVERQSSKLGGNDEIDETHYLPAMKSKPISIRNGNVDIFEIKILNDSGRIVNVLRTGESYVYQYKVRFHEDYANISLGTQFKTVNGLMLSALSLYHQNRLIKQVRKGDIITMKVGFNCQLLQGNYFLNAGVSVHESGQEMYFLNRIVDALLFKVVQERQSLTRGLVEQDYEVSVV